MRQSGTFRRCKVVSGRFRGAGAWVGGFADHHAKSRVLIAANMIKQWARLIVHACRAVIGLLHRRRRRAIYGPAKYGILPELAGHQFLVKANSLVEGSTILAILMGMQIGAKAADHSTDIALAGTNCVVHPFRLWSWLLLPAKAANHPASGSKILEFGKAHGAVFCPPAIPFFDARRIPVLGHCGNLARG